MSNIEENTAKMGTEMISGTSPEITYSFNSFSDTFLKETNSLPVSVQKRNYIFEGV